MRQKVAVIGLGFVGLTLASFIGSMNIQVTGVEHDKEKIKNLRKGETHFFEPNLQHYLKKALKCCLNLATKIPNDIASFDFIFITDFSPSSFDFP